MRTVKNIGKKYIKLTSIDFDKIAASCLESKVGPSCFYNFGFPSNISFTEYKDGGHSAFIKSMRFSEKRVKY